MSNELYNNPEFVKKSKTGVLTKELTKKEFPWLPRDLEEGSLVFKHYDVYGLCRSNHVAFTLYPNTFPFFEAPKDSIKWD